MWRTGSGGWDIRRNELINDLIPAVERKYSTYAEGTSPEKLIESRSHRAFAGFSMGSVTTWHTFQYCMDYFRYFLPSSGNLTSDGAYMEQLVTDADNENDGNLAYRVQEGNAHDWNAALQYIYNGLLWLWGEGD